MGFVRALVALVLFAMATSPLAGRWIGTSADAPSVYADSGRLVVQGKHDERDKEKKERNSSSDEDARGNRIKTPDEKKDEMSNSRRTTTSRATTRIPSLAIISSSRGTSSG